MVVNAKGLASWMSLVLSVGVLLAGVYGYRRLERGSQEMKQTIVSLQDNSSEPADDPIEGRLAAVKAQLKKIELLEESLNDLRNNVQSEDAGSLTQRVTSLEGKLETIARTRAAEKVRGARARLKLWREDKAVIDPNDATKGSIGAKRERLLRQWIQKRELNDSIDRWILTAPVEDLFLALNELAIP